MKSDDHGAVYEATVPFHDCDPLAIVWFGHYYKYLEHARTALMKRYRLDMRDFMQLGYKLVVVESRCRYSYPLRYDDRFRVHARFLETEARLKIGYEVTNVTAGRRSARATTTLVVTDPAGVMLMEVPDAIRQRIAGG